MSESGASGSFRPFARLAGVANAVMRTAANAIALAEDAELRKKASDLVVGQASKQFTTIRHGVVTTADSVQQRLRQGPSQVQQVLVSLQRRLEDQRLLVALKMERDAPVDVQIGPQLYEHAPQELRSRLWMALLDNPSLASSVQRSALSRNGSSSPSDGMLGDAGRLASAAAPSQQQPSCPSATSPAEGHPAREASAQAAVLARTEAGGAGGSATPQPEAGRADNGHLPSSAQHLREAWHTHSSSISIRAASPVEGHLSPRRSSEAGSGDSGPAAGDTAKAAGNSATSTSDDSTATRAAAPDASMGSLENWEMVQDSSNISGFEASAALTSRLHPSQHAELSPADVAVWQKLMMGILSVPWPIAAEYPEDCRYNTLLQISIGQEETDDVIARDIYRTFPEHPQFGFEQGQQALFRVLKAYSLHDLEVNYCQGMAFVAGIILMYLPEEPAFRMLMALMGESGANLRRLYTPGLEGLKAELRKFEWLMQRHFPALAAHLLEHSVVPVLYASQWLLTLFSCPFPAAFACRIVDTILTEGNAEILLQVALAVCAECEAAVLQLDDFEDIITYLKVEPVQWSVKHQRKVLNAALASSITPDMIRAADFAVANGFCGSLSRRQSSRHDVSAAPAAAPAADSPNVLRLSNSDLAQRLPSLAIAAGLPGDMQPVTAEQPQSSGDEDGDAGPGMPGAVIQLAEDDGLILALHTMFPVSDTVSSSSTGTGAMLGLQPTTPADAAPLSTAS